MALALVATGRMVGHERSLIVGQITEQVVRQLLGGGMSRWHLRHRSSFTRLRVAEKVRARSVGQSRSTADPPRQQAAYRAPLPHATKNALRWGSRGAITAPAAAPIFLVQARFGRFPSGKERERGQEPIKKIVIGS